MQAARSSSTTGQVQAGEIPAPSTLPAAWGQAPRALGSPPPGVGGTSSSHGDGS